MITLDDIELPSDLSWPEEFQSRGVAQTTKRAISGAAVVQTALLTGGLPITLTALDDRAWFPRATALRLRDLAASPGRRMTLKLRGEARRVTWRHEDAPACDLKPLGPPDDDHVPDGLTVADWFIGSIKFITV